MRQHRHPRLPDAPGFAGLAIGSEAGGGIRNVYAQNLLMDGTSLRQGLFVKSTSHYGGDVQGIHRGGGPVRLSYYYLDDPPDGPYRPSFRDISVANMSCARSDEEAIHIKGFPDAQIAGVRLTDCTFTGVARIEPLLANVTDLRLDRVTINGTSV